LWLLAWGALVAPAARGAAGEPGRIDVQAIKSKLKILDDGKGHYLAVVPTSVEVEDHLYYGDGRTFYAQRVLGWSGEERSGEASFVFWEPRVSRPALAQLELRDQRYLLTCAERKTELKLLPATETATLLERAVFAKPRWPRRAYALARDNNGRYYYVDRLREPEDNKNFRLFAGPKGNMKQLRMTNVVSDSEGDIFATKTGSLRLILNKNESVWVKGKTQQKLISLPLDDNHVLIYSDLGVYTGQPLGTPCDDL
jgi:hypothetical protein